MMFFLGLTTGIIIAVPLLMLVLKPLEKQGLQVDIRPRKIRTNGKHKPIMYTDKKAIELEQ
jgi:hypothetical protein